MKVGKWKKILPAIFCITVMALMFFLGPFICFLLIFGIILFGYFTESKNRYLKLQTILPTSKIRSMAMGLVEIEGSVKGIEKIIAPIESKECIGYRYVIEERRTNKNGKTSYRTIHEETQCNCFVVSDESGSVKVLSEKLDFIMFPVDEQYHSGGNRHTQYVLYENDKVLLIGKAALENNIPVITHEEIKNVFGIAPISEVGRWNRFKPLRTNALLFLTIVAFLTGILLILSIKEVDGLIVIGLSEHIFSW